jgi:8-oxo-dGTP diphosphatase
MKEHKIVVGGIVLEDGELPIVREKHSHIEDKWNLPVGGLEGNETLEEGAKREMEEETGLEVEINGLIGVYQNPERPSGQNAVKFIFKASRKSGELSCPNELKENKWISIEEFQKISEEELRDKCSKLAVQDLQNKGKLYPEAVKYFGGV